LLNVCDFQRASVLLIVLERTPRPQKGRRGKARISGILPASTAGRPRELQPPPVIPYFPAFTTFRRDCLSSTHPPPVSSLPKISINRLRSFASLSIFFESRKDRATNLLEVAPFTHSRNRSKDMSARQSYRAGKSTQIRPASTVMTIPN
jgi:hypothetical protein